MSIFVCSKCNSQFPKWLGQCPECGAWGSITEQSSVNLVKNKKDSRQGNLIKFNQSDDQVFQKIQTRNK